MGAHQLLVDTDVLIAYLNRRAHRSYLERPDQRVYYSAVTKKELLSKPGLRDAERRAIVTLLSRFRLVRIDRRVADQYSRIRRLYPSLARADALIAASALARRMPLLTLNSRHCRSIEGLHLLPTLEQGRR